MNGDKKNFSKIEVRLSIGVKIDPQGNATLLSGPVMAVRKNSDYFLTLLPGSNPTEAFIDEIKRRLLLKAAPDHKAGIEKITPEEIFKHLPNGTVTVAE